MWKSCLLWHPRCCHPSGELQTAVPWQRTPGHPRFHYPQQIYPKTANNSVFTSLNKKSIKPLPVSYSEWQQIPRENMYGQTYEYISLPANAPSFPKALSSAVPMPTLCTRLIASWNQARCPNGLRQWILQLCTVQRQPLLSPLSPLHTGKTQSHRQ